MKSRLLTFGGLLSAIVVCAFVFYAQSLPAQSPENPKSAVPVDATAPAEAQAVVDELESAPLHGQQDAIAQRFKRFERLLLQMANYMQKTDPEQADLLIRAIGQSKSDRISGQMAQIVTLLEQNQLGDAIDREAQVIESLQSLLDLLQSGERRSELQKEQERIQDLLKDVQATIGREKDARASNERGDDIQRAIERQEIAEASGRKLVDKIDGQDAQRAGKNSEGKEGEGKEGEGKEGEGKEGEGKPGEGKPGEGKPGEGKPGEGKPGEGKPGEGKPGEGKPGEQGDDAKTPGRDEIAQAVERMDRAIEELKRKNHENASKEQSEALAKLEEAKAKLEEILRQLREEERELLLAALEARFQKMLAMQILVYTGTVNLDKTPEPQWTSRHRARSRELAQTEDDIALEAVKALDLLKEEGSSIAFPEAVEQMRSDMLTVARRLENSQVGELTQAIEQDLIEALQEVIEALQKEMEKGDQEDSESQDQQQQQQPPPLVDKIAELKMLRSLQQRINRRTKILAREFRGEDATDPEIAEQLQELSRRQSRIQQTTYDLATGRNQ